MILFCAMAGNRRTAIASPDLGSGTNPGDVSGIERSVVKAKRGKLAAGCVTSIHPQKVRI